LRSLADISFLNVTEESVYSLSTRKICKAALALISGSLCKDFHFMQLSLFSECQSKLQICSSERNIRLLPVGLGKDNLENNAGIYTKKICIKDTVMVSIP